MLTKGQKIKEICLHFILQIIIPTADVYTDVVLIISLFQIRNMIYALMLLVPFLLNYILTWIKMWRLDKNRKYSIVAAFLSCYPQYMAVKVIHLLMTNPDRGMEKKRKLEREVTELECFVEAVPSALVITYIC